MRNNPAIGLYINAWIDLIMRLPQMHEPNHWHPQISHIDGDLFELFELANDDLAAALHGYRFWQNATRKAPVQRPVIWREGGSSLLDYGGSGEPVLIIPSMINGYQILDIPDASLINAIKESGCHVYLLDWGSMTEADLDLDIQGYQSRLRAAATEVNAQACVGYCLGGTLTALAAPSGIKRQVLIGAPWRFQHDQGRIGQWAKQFSTMQSQDFDPFINAMNVITGVLPSHAVDYFFAGLNPLQFVQKFRDFGQNNKSNASVERFVAVEDWLTSGRDLPIPFVRELMMEWLAQDKLAKSSIQLKTPTLAIYGQRDHIAPPASCEAIQSHFTQSKHYIHNSGHVGLLIGARARAKIWPQIIEFLRYGFAK